MWSVVASVVLCMPVSQTQDATHEHVVRGQRGSQRRLLNLIRAFSSNNVYELIPEICNARDHCGNMPLAQFLRRGILP
jgi:hypothetical protein